MLIKDTTTGKKSITTTFTVLSTLQTLVILSIFTYKVMVSGLSYEDVSVPLISLGLTGIFVGIYWNKKVRISKEGLDIGNDSTR